MSPDSSEDYGTHLFSFTFKLIAISFLCRFQISLLQTCLQSQMISQTFWIWMKMINKTFHAPTALTLQGKELNKEKHRNVVLIKCTFAMFNFYFFFLKMHLPSLGILGIFFFNHYCFAWLHQNSRFFPPKECMPHSFISTGVKLQFYKPCIA